MKNDVRWKDLVDKVKICRNSWSNWDILLRGLQRTNGNFGQSATVLPPGEQHSTLFDFPCCSRRQVAIGSVRGESQKCDGCQDQEHDIDQPLLQQRQVAGRREEMVRSFVPDDVLEPIDGSIQRIVHLVLQQLRHASDVFLVPFRTESRSVGFKQCRPVTFLYYVQNPFLQPPN